MSYLKSKMFDPVGLIGLVTSVYLIVKFAQSRRKTTPLPPGPKGKWIIGNALDVPLNFPWLKFHEFYEKFGGFCLENGEEIAKRL